MVRGVASGPKKGDTADETVQGQSTSPFGGRPGARPQADVDRQPLSPAAWGLSRTAARAQSV